MKEIKRKLVEYFTEEFGTRDWNKSFEDCANIGIGFTTVDNEDLGLYDVERQIMLDLEHMEVRKYLDNYLVDAKRFATIEELEDYVTWLSFDEEMYTTEEEWDKFFAYQKKN